MTEPHPTAGVPYPLGRRLEPNHDPRSRAYPVRVAPTQPASVLHHHGGPILNQGPLGSCTGNAIVNALNARPLRHRRRFLDETDAVRLYGAATRLDPWPGDYPPDDTGSSGLAAAKAAQREGLIIGYQHAFTHDEILLAITRAPVIVGVPWFDGMFTPDPAGFVHPTGTIVGGHEFAILGQALHSEYFTALNSWGAGWGDAGRFRIRFDDLWALLEHGGDVTCPLI